MITLDDIKATIDDAAPHQLYLMALAVRDAYVTGIRNGVELDPKLLRGMNENVEFYRKRLQ